MQGFFSIQLTIIIIGLKNIICYTARVSLTWWFIICGFHCTVHKSCAEVTPLCVVQLYK